MLFPLTVTSCGFVPVPVASVVQSAFRRVKVIFPPAAAPFVALMDGYVALPPLVPGSVAVPLSVALSCDRFPKVDRRRPGRGVQGRRYRENLEALARWTRRCRSERQSYRSEFCPPAVATRGREVRRRGVFAGQVVFIHRHAGSRPDLDATAGALTARDRPAEEELQVPFHVSIRSRRWWPSP